MLVPATKSVKPTTKRSCQGICFISSGTAIAAAKRKIITMMRSRFDFSKGSIRLTQMHAQTKGSRIRIVVPAELVCSS